MTSRALTLRRRLAAIWKNGPLFFKWTTYGFGMLGFLIVCYGIYKDMIGWTLPTYAIY